MPHQYIQIFCDNCSSLALARLGGIHLCTSCLVNVVAAHSSEDIAKITQLKLCLHEAIGSTPVQGE